MSYYEQARDEACGYLGIEITDSQWNEALPEAERKLERIIDREGDADGERRKPYYLGKLVEEAIRAKAFTEYCIMKRLERRNAHETIAAHS